MASANERTGKGWIAARNTPGAEHLIMPLEHSDDFLDAILRLANRPTAMLPTRPVAAVSRRPNCSRAPPRTAPRSDLCESSAPRDELAGFSDAADRLFRCGHSLIDAVGERRSVGFDQRAGSVGGFSRRPRGRGDSSRPQVFVSSQQLPVHGGRHVVNDARPIHCRTCAIVGEILPSHLRNYYRPAQITAFSAVSVYLTLREALSASEAATLLSGRACTARQAHLAGCSGPE